jgi:hypothetical protein
MAGVVLFLGGCAGAPRWGAWSTYPSSAEIAQTLDAYPYENYNYPQPDPAQLGRPAEPGSGRAAAAEVSAPRRPPQLEVTKDPSPSESETDAEEPETP